MSIFEKFVPVDMVSIGKIPGVYKAANKDTGEYYIGASSKLSNRINAHISALKNGKHNGHGKSEFQKVFNGSQDFTFEVILTETKEAAFSLEKMIISQCLEDTFCMNMVNSPGIPVEVSDTTKEKIRDSLNSRYASGEVSPCKGRKSTDLTREKIAIASKKKWENLEYRQKQMEIFNSPEFKERMSKLHSGKTESEETRMRKSVAKKGIPQSKELIKKRADALRGRVKSEEELESFKLKLRETISGLPEDKNNKRLGTLAESSKLAAEKTRLPIIFNGTKYKSRSEAIKGEGISSSTFYKLLREQGYEVKK